MPAKSKNLEPEVIDLQTYLRLFKPYEAQLKEFIGRNDFRGDEEQYGARFALLFRQAARLLTSQDEFNQRLPKHYIALAERYLNKDHDTVRHFSYEENRYYFLSEFLEWLKVHERGEKMRNFNVSTRS